MKPHECRESDICTCYAHATDPSDDCPIHGLRFLPARCGICGKFLKQSYLKDKALEHSISKMEYEEYR